MGAITGPFGSNGGKKSHPEPKLLAYGGAKTATFALQKIHFSNVRLWREADIGRMTATDPKRTLPCVCG